MYPVSTNSIRRWEMGSPKVTEAIGDPGSWPKLGREALPALLRREDDRLPEVEELGLTGADLVHLLHVGLQLWRYLLAFAFPGVRLGSEVHDHGVRTAIMSHGHASDHVGTKCGPLV